MKSFQLWQLLVGAMFAVSGLVVPRAAIAGRCESILSQEGHHGRESFDVARLVTDLFREVPKQPKPFFSFLRNSDDLAGAKILEIDSALFRSVLENTKALDSIDGFLLSYLDSKLTRLNTTFVSSRLIAQDPILGREDLAEKFASRYLEAGAHVSVIKMVRKPNRGRDNFEKLVENKNQFGFSVFRDGEAVTAFYRDQFNLVKSRTELKVPTPDIELARYANGRMTRINNKVVVLLENGQVLTSNQYLYDVRRLPALTDKLPSLEELKLLAFANYGKSWGHARVEADRDMGGRWDFDDKGPSRELIDLIGDLTELNNSYYLTGLAVLYRPLNSSHKELAFFSLSELHRRGLPIEGKILSLKISGGEYQAEYQDLLQ